MAGLPLNDLRSVCPMPSSVNLQPVRDSLTHHPSSHGWAPSPALMPCNVMCIRVCVFCKVFEVCVANKVVVVCIHFSIYLLSLPMDFMHLMMCFGCPQLCMHSFGVGLGKRVCI